MSIQSDLLLLEQARTDIQNAITDKGVIITEPLLPLLSAAGYIDQISAKDNSMIDGYVSGASDTLSSDTVTSVAAYRFNGYTRLLHVDFPNVETINQYAFDGCGIREANFPRCTALAGNNTFRGAYITSASFPALVNAPGNYAFRACMSLSNVEFPSLRYGGQYMFQQCNALQEAKFDSLISIGYQMFVNSPNFAKLTLGTTEQVCYPGSGSFNQTPFASGGGEIYVPASMVDAYKNNPNWSGYADRIFAIP